MELPVYLFTGFLEAGKTRFIQETLEDERFNAGERTLLLVCEEGVEEYAPEQFSGKNVFIEVLDDSSQLNADHLAKLQMAHNAERCVVEYNGMWLLDELYQNMPEDWVIYQEICFADANTFLSYNANMRQLMVDKLINDGTATVEVLDTNSKWFGVTYPEDRQSVVDKIKALVDAGEYPAKLF